MSLQYREMGRVRIAPVCDVDVARLTEAVKKVGEEYTPYRDYCHVLQRSDLDAVVIATPDHWHAVQMVQACKSGKHAERRAAWRNCHVLADARRR